MIKKKATSQSSGKMISLEIRGIIDFPKVHEPVAKYRKEESTNMQDKEYTVNLRLTTEKEISNFISILAGIGITVKNPEKDTNIGKFDRRLKEDKEGNMYFTFKRNAMNSKGKIAELEVVDAEGEDIPKNILIGNGSEAIIKLFAYETSDGEMSLGLGGIQVLTLVAAPKKKISKYAGFSVKALKESGTTTVSDEDSDDGTNPF